MEKIAWMEELFGAEPVSEAERLAGLVRLEAAEAERIAALPSLSEPSRLRPVCSRCSGAGRIGAFSHVAGGVCFACGGSGFKEGV